MRENVQIKVYGENDFSIVVKNDKLLKNDAPAVLVSVNDDIGSIDGQICLTLDKARDLVEALKKIIEMSDGDA